MISFDVAGYIRLSKEDRIKDELIKKFSIEQLDRKILNELIDIIYITDKNNVKIELKNICYNNKI